MTAVTLGKGWCPSLLQPMESGDGWLVRIKPRATTLRTGAVRALTDAASRYGNGQIDLTARANLQVRGFSLASAESFAEVALDHGLAVADAGLEQIRNVMASPLGPDDASASFNSHAVAEAIEDVLTSERSFQALPAKFGIAVDGGGALPFAGVRADIVVRGDGSDIAVSIAGDDFAHCCAVELAPEVVRRLAQAYLALGVRQNERPCRMADLVGRIGAITVFAAAGLDAEPRAEPERVAPAPPVGLIAYPGGASFGAGLPFGRVDAGTLAALADFAERHGDGTLRTTPWRVLLLTCVRPVEAEILGDTLARLGLITDADDARLAIHACVGAPSCRNASVSTRADAAKLAALSATCGLTLHVSGCEKGCACREAADVTLVGRDGCYDVVRNGRPDDPPSLVGVTIGQTILHLERRP